MSFEEDLPKNLPAYLTQTIGQTTYHVDLKNQSVSFQNGGSQAVTYKAGDIVGNSYKLLSQAGRGGMGVVYLAEHLIIQQKYALKLLAPDQINESSWKRFEIEGRALALLNHQNIVKIYNMGIDQGGCPFYVMDWLPGSSLEDAIRQNSLSYHQIISAYRQVCAGLGSAHTRGIVHRDVKPSNIMLTGDIALPGSVKVVDFGIASVSALDPDAQAATGYGEICGSPLYMSPEQCRGDKVDQRSDIYSLGCSLYNSLTGLPPFIGKNALATVLMHQEAPPPTLAAAKGTTIFNDSIEQLINKALQKDPNKRYQTMEQIAHDLERIAEGKPIAKGQAIRTSKNNDAEPSEEYRSDITANKPMPAPLLFLIIIGSFTAVSLFAFSQWKTFEPRHHSETIVVPQNNIQINQTEAKNDPKEIMEQYNPNKKIQNALLTCMLSPYSVFDRFGHHRTFNCPHSFSLGDISPGFHTPKANLQDVVDVLDEPLTIRMNGKVGEYPPFLSRFDNENIEGFVLNDCEQNSEKVIEQLSRWKHLVSLELKHDSFDSGDISALNRLSHLQRLILNEVDLDGDKIAKLDGLLRHLFALDLNGIPNTGALFTKLSKSDNFAYLRMAKVDLTPAEVETLSHSKLHTFMIVSDNLSDADVKKICRLPDLQELYIKGDRITEACVDSIVDCKKLKKLTIVSAKIFSAAARAKLHRTLAKQHCLIFCEQIPKGSE